MQTYSDEYLHCWGEVYLNNKISEHHVPFDLFLQEPNGYLLRLQNNRPVVTEGTRPLLPVQIAVLNRLQQEDMIRELEDQGEADHKGNTLELHGDHLMAPIHHRDAPKKWKTNTRRKHS